MKQVRVVYHIETEGVWAESPDAPGYLATAESIEELRQLIAEGIAFFLEEPKDSIEIVEDVPVSVRFTGPLQFDAGGAPASAEIYTSWRLASGLLFTFTQTSKSIPA